MYKLTLLLVLCSCTNTYTRGDAATELSEAWCDFLTSCGYGSDTCVRHNVFHLCELEETCDREFTATDALDRCVFAIEQSDQCIAAVYGLTPRECGDFWEAYETN